MLIATWLSRRMLRSGTVSLTDFVIVFFTFNCGVFFHLIYRVDATKLDREINQIKMLIDSKRQIEKEIAKKSESLYEQTECRKK